MSDSQQEVQLCKRVVAILCNRKAFALVASMRLLYLIFSGDIEYMWTEMLALSFVFLFYQTVACLTITMSPASTLPADVAQAQCRGAPGAEQQRPTPQQHSAAH